MLISFLLFLVSFILIFASSYLITSLLAKKNDVLGILYIPIIAFSQIVFTFEFLSLFKLIKVPTVLLFNFIIFVVSYLIWNKKQRSFWKIEKTVVKDFIIKIKNALKLDRSLIVLGVCFLFFVSISLFLSMTMPITSGDGNAYHVARSFFFVINGCLNHFQTTDIRALCLPINSEILYSWVILFMKKDVFLQMFSFTAFILTIINIFNIMGLIKFSYRRRLWIIFILSSFSSVLAQASGTETDIIISALITSSIFMFWQGLKTDDKISIFMSALSYALAIGTKTPSIIMIPAVGFLMLYLCFCYKKYKPFFIFLGFGILNFLIFSSYNYILNFVEYKNIAGPENFMVVSKNYYGIKGAFANFIKYIFMFFDFTGFRWPDFFMLKFVGIKDAILAFLGLGYIPDGLYTTDVYFQRSLIDHNMGAGVLGFLVFLPCWISALLQFNLKNKTKRFVFVFALVMLINLIMISYLLAYMSYTVRFFVSFLILSSPILTFSYFSNKSILKYFIIYFSIYYLFFVSSHIWSRPFFRITNYLKQGKTLSEIRTIAVCNYFSKDIDDFQNAFCKVNKHIKEYGKDKNFLYITDDSRNSSIIGKMILEGYNIEIANPEKLAFVDKDFNKYDFIVFSFKGFRSTNITSYEERKNDFVVDSKSRIAKQIVDRPIPCFYEYNSRIPAYDKKGKLRMPLAVICSFENTEFFNNIKFIPYKAVGVANTNSIENSNIYIFFRNNNQQKQNK